MSLLLHSHLFLKSVILISCLLIHCLQGEWETRKKGGLRQQSLPIKSNRLILPKQFHQLGMKRSNIWAFRGHFQSIYHREQQLLPEEKSHLWPLKLRKSRDHRGERQAGRTKLRFTYLTLLTMLFCKVGRMTMPPWCFRPNPLHPTQWPAQDPYHKMKACDTSSVSS